MRFAGRYFPSSLIKMKCRFIVWFLISAFLVVSFGIAFWRVKSSSLESFYLLGFDSFIEIRVNARDLNRLRPQVERLVEDLDRKWNRFSPGSEISLLNNSRQKVKLSPDTVLVLQKALSLQQKTGGYFNPFLGSLMDAWHFSSGQPSLPEEETLRKLVLDVQNTSLLINLETNEAQLLGTAKIDLGGIGKGYLVDKISSFFRESGVSVFLINAGGSVLVEGKEFKIGIKNPRGEGIIGSVKLKEGVVDTSGDYFRFFISNGERYFHILNPFTGFPCKDFRSVTVISREGSLSDALSTALMAGGKEVLFSIMRSFPEIGICIVDARNEVWITPNMFTKFKFSIEKGFNYHLLDLDSQL